METRITIDGHTWKWDAENNMYECRGDVEYDDDHDEVPEESLWVSGIKLKRKLSREGHKVELDYSEKGWCEVQVYKFEN